MLTTDVVIENEGVGDSYGNVELINNIQNRYVGAKMIHLLLGNNRWLKFDIDTGTDVTVVGLVNVEKILGKIIIDNTNNNLCTLSAITGQHPL